MSESREPRASVVVVRPANPKRVGPLKGWAWRDARDAIQLGKRQGAYAVEFRPSCVRYLLPEDTSSGLVKPGCHRRTGADSVKPPRVDPPRDEAPPRRADDMMLDEPEGKLSKRKQKSKERLQEFQRRKRLSMLWQRVLHKFARSWRHERMWRVHNAWYATPSAPAEATGPPVAETAHMDEEPVLEANTAPADAASSAAHGPPPHGSSAATSEFAPGISMAEVQAAWSAAVAKLGKVPDSWPPDSRFAGYPVPPPRRYVVRYVRTTR